MNEFIIYADPRSAGDIASLAFEELGRVDNGVWLICPDQTIRAMAGQQRPEFLYFDRPGYASATTGLTSSQVQDVIRYRRDHWTSQSMHHAMSWLFDWESVVLEGALGMAGQGMPGAASEVEKSLALLQRLGGLARYKRLPPKAMAVTVLEGESLLQAAVSSAMNSSAGESWPDGRSADAVARVAAALGAKVSTHAPPFADASRGVFLHPASKEFADGLERRGDQCIAWRDGIVFVSTERRLISLSEQSSTDILYADPGDFYYGVEFLTPAQLQRDFATRLERSPEEKFQDQASHFDRLHLHQILIRRELRARPDTAQLCQSAGLNEVLAADLTLLGRSIARRHSFSIRQGVKQPAHAQQIFHQAQEMVDSGLSLFTFIAGRYWPDVAPALHEIQSLNIPEQVGTGFGRK